MPPNTCSDAKKTRKQKHQNGNHLRSNNDALYNMELLRLRGFQLIDFELLDVLGINEPAACGLDMLARRDGCRGADDRGEIGSPLNLHPKNRKTVLGVVVGHTFDGSIQSFGHRQEVVTPFAVKFTPLLFLM